MKQLCSSEPAPGAAPVTRQQHQQAQQQQKQQRGSHVVLRQRGCGPEPILAIGPANARPSGQIAGRLGSGVFVGTFKGVWVFVLLGLLFCFCAMHAHSVCHLMTQLSSAYRGNCCKRMTRGWLSRQGMGELQERAAALGREATKP